MAEIEQAVLAERSETVQAAAQFETVTVDAQGGMVQSVKDLGNTFIVVSSLKSLFDKWLRFLALPKVLPSCEPCPQGKIANCRTGTVEYHREDLGSGVCLDLVRIPGGTFLMGSPSGEGDDDEKPQHEVTVKPFLMGKYPVTQAQWRAVAAMPQVNRELTPNPSEFTGDLRPVEQVSWEDAVEFCGRLTLHTNCQYRLPTEAEWEYACRSGTTTPFYFGETITPDLANYDGNYTYGLGPQGEYRQQTTEVGSFDGANAFGLYDMHGNVWEWCQDYWHDDYKGAPSDGTAWMSGGDSSTRLLRGGSWFSLPRVCRSASRNGILPVNWYSGIGLRVVCDAARTLL